MSGTRWRLVGTQNGGEEHINSVVFSEEEARESLRIEAEIHERYGWTVTVGLNDEGETDVVIARKVLRRGQPTVRAITVREFDPLNDVQTEET